MNNDYIIRRNADEARARLTRALVSFAFNVSDAELLQQQGAMPAPLLPAKLQCICPM